MRALPNARAAGDPAYLLLPVPKTAAEGRARVEGGDEAEHAVVIVHGEWQGNGCTRWAGVVNEQRNMNF